jgi:hypothetical protein
MTVDNKEAERLNRKNWKLSGISRRNKEMGFWFFSRSTMKFFGDTMKSFRVRYDGSEIFVERVLPSKYMGNSCKTWKFNPETGDLKPVIDYPF